MNCIQFPRFYFLEREKLIETLSYSKDCRKYSEIVKQCFTGVKDLIYSLPKRNEEETDKFATKEDSSKNSDLQNNLTQLEFDINGKACQSELAVINFAFNYFLYFKS